MFNVLFIPYRDLYFWREYGSAVRDLQFLEVLLNFSQVNKITILNRPVSIYERITNKKNSKFNYPDVTVIDTTSFDLIGPLKKRSWTVSCYNRLVTSYVGKYLKEECDIPLLIMDFTPLAKIPFIKNDRVLYWYDMIDNFTKHNCYTENEKKLVDEKYHYVAEKYNYMTSVSDVASEAIRKYNNINMSVVTNGVFTSRFIQENLDISSSRPAYDFGFVGFITDKFDVEFVRKLAKKYSIVVYGEAYNKDIAEQLTLAGVKVMGRFSYSQLPELIGSFSIGLLPYLAEKSHDGSPLKMYEYLKNNKPCMTSIDYEFSCEFVVNYNTSLELDSDIERLIACSGAPGINKSLPEDSFLYNKLAAAFSSMVKQVI